MFQRLVTLLFITAVLSEPECSRFHYEEQTLNKMIRQEIAMEKLQADMAATQQQVLDTLGKLTETTQQLSDDWNNEKIKLERETNDFMEGTNKSIQNEMAKLKRVTNEMTEETNRSIRNFAADLEKLKGPTVAFRSNDLVDHSPSSGETLVFKTTTLNEGLGYDNKSGIFTAPVAGTYTFSVQLCVDGGKDMYYAIVADGVDIKKGWFCDEKWKTCYTTDTVAVLQKDSKVNVKCSAGSSTLRATGNYWNTFSGVLVQL
ncbi:uncharacterized protein LOC132740473 isoform X1 [Ruditapes philippinarum]|uniref:uncharacterized protein LOC132740473 isoform X1 n=1 Tax=Ruditapes philippinarum TaxID=129788 RepID=UPI00295B0127|nr:uncharacterized protein LOC132740473 isoform X1 [Ruditapes philippinarum]